MEKELKQYGLTDKEIVVYMTCLKLGSSTVNRIASKAKVIRTSTYDILRSLIEKGLVSYVIKDKKKYFEAAAPEKLISNLEEKKKAIKGILPQLNELRTSAIEKPKIEIYEGVEGIKTVYEDILKEKRSLVSFSSTRNLYMKLQHYVEQFIIRRNKARINIRLLTEPSKETLKTMKERDPKQRRITRFLPGLKDIPITQYVYGSKVAIMSTGDKEPMGIIIENEDFAREQLLLFEQLWRVAKR